MVFLCVDVGTSVIKTVAFDRAGNELALARENVAVSRPSPSFSEQDMRGVWNTVVFTTRSAIAQLGAGPIQGIAITGQGDGCWLVDERGEPTGPAILWNDARATAIVDAWQEGGLLARAFRLSGSLAFAGLPSAILRWLSEQEPERLARSHLALTCDGWVFSQLTGVFAIDESDASNPFFDIHRRAYSRELMSIFGLEWVERLLPPVLRGVGRVGELSAHAAGQLDVPAGVPVVMAPYDIVAMALGVGAASPGRACSILGTTLCTEVVTDQLDLSGSPAGSTIAFDVPGQHLRAMPTLAGCEVLDWAARLLELDRASDVAALAGGVAPGAEGLLFLPYLSPAGERAPFLDPSARGTLAGLSLRHDRRHIARAILEGLSLVVLDCLDATRAKISELNVCGGGARSDVWCQLLADLTGVPTYRSAENESGAKGAFLSALVALGLEKDLGATAHAYRRAPRLFEPAPARTAYYRCLRDDFAALREVSARGWHRPRAGGTRA